jgi:hypothetical protein
MVNQLERLKSLAAGKPHRLGIIPWSARLTVTVPPGFQVYDRTLVVDFPHQKVCLTRERDVEPYVRLFEALERVAVAGDEAVLVLDRIIQDFERLQELERTLNTPSV